MSVDYDDEKADRMLAEAEIIVADEPGPMPELLDAVASPTVDALGTEGMTPHEGSKGELGRERAFCQGPLLVFHRRRNE